jgi:dimethylaniline monooxygenase (N-oxide forming)
VKACIIGAGPSGITTAKSLAQSGVDFDWFEKGSALGGLWRYDNDSGTSAAYRSLQIDTSSRALQYPDFPVPADWPDYLRHTQVLEYLESYARHFGVHDRVRTRAEVTSVARDGDRWHVETAAGSGDYDAVIVANGHLSTPRLPEFPGEFAGEQLHSHGYRVPDPYTDRTVVVVGMGNSGCDIAVDLARPARQVYLSTRSSAWVLPKYLLGRPTDRWTRLLTGRLRLPVPLARRVVGRLTRLVVGDQRRFGIPAPRHGIHQAHGTVGQELPSYVAYGWIGMKPDVARLAGDRVEFTDGTSVEADAIVYATGYDVSFPFLPADVVEALDGGTRLYRRIAAPEHPGLYFVGLVQPVGPTIPLAEIQGRWVARVLDKGLVLPDRAAMDAEIAAQQAWTRRRFTGSARHRLEVDYRDHATQLTTDLAG